MERSSEARTVSLVHFGAIREKIGLSCETLVTEAATPRALYRELEERYGLEIPLSALSVAVNGILCDVDEPFGSGSTIIYLPPFGGG